MIDAKKSVLIVDDSSMARMYYREALAAAGFVVSEALNGLEALEKVLTAPADILVVDINMPKMDGLTFLQALRQQRQPIASIPALVTSTEAAASDRVAAIEAGANYYLVKPVTQETLVQYVRLLAGVPQ